MWSEIYLLFTHHFNYCLFGFASILSLRSGPESLRHGGRGRGTRGGRGVGGGGDVRPGHVQPEGRPDVRQLHHVRCDPHGHHDHDLYFIPVAGWSGRPPAVSRRLTPVWPTLTAAPRLSALRTVTTVRQQSSFKHLPSDLFWKLKDWRDDWEITDQRWEDAVFMSSLIHLWWTAIYTLYFSRILDCSSGPRPGWKHSKVWWCASSIGVGSK